jgi:drug/metabolite transporter (DMT)-like permease
MQIDAHEPLTSSIKPKIGTSVPFDIRLGLVLAIILDTGVQLCWKQAVPPAENQVGLAVIFSTVKQPVFWAAMLMFGAQFYNWIKVLAKADLSYAQPITALSYVSVTMFSVLFLHEQVNVFRLLGISCILLGVWFICRTQHCTTTMHETMP